MNYFIYTRNNECEAEISEKKSFHLYIINTDIILFKSQGLFYSIIKIIILYSMHI